MAEGRRTELEQRLAKSRGRLPTDSELWCQRLARSLDERGAEGGTRAPAFRQSAGGPQRPADVPRRDLGGAARRPRAPDQSQVEENPWHGSDRETRDRAVRELFDELGERVGIGEPPSSFFERP
jgi:hypothetical protein